MQKDYQLTSYPSGSKREFWTLTWPLMLGLLSSTIMLFVDRLFLAQWHPLALNAAVTGSMAYFIFLVTPMGVVEITEVVVGRLHGEERHQEIGSAAWQMALLSFALLPLFWLIASEAPFFIFNGSSNQPFETTYFYTLMLFAPCQCTVIALSGFFIGIGQVKIVTYSAILGNAINIVMDYWMIFGGGPMPELGVMGAAAATGVAQIMQLIFLLFRFWSHSNRKKYGTLKLKFNKSFALEGIKIGLPSGAGRSIEVVAHFLFFRIVMSVSPEQMALAAIAQSIYILFSFVIEAQCKGASAIVANLLGAKEHKPLSRVLRSAFSLHFCYFALLFTLVWSFPEAIFALFSSDEGNALQMTPALMVTFKNALICIALFFLVDGFGWILIGFLTAAKDTRYIFWVSILVNWVAYIPPTFWLVGWNKGGADVAWGIIVAVTSLSLLLYFWRYASGKWLERENTSIEDHTTPEIREAPL